MSQSLRVLLVTQNLYPYAIGGTARLADTFCSALAQRGHSVTCLRYDRGDASQPNPSPPYDVLTFGDRRRGRLLSKAADGVISAFARARRELGQRDFDVLAFNDAPPWFGWHLGAPRRLPTVYLLHASIYEQFRIDAYRNRLDAPPMNVLVKPWAKPLAAQAFRLIEGVCLRAADGIVAISRYTAGDIGRLYKLPERRMRIIPVPIDTETFRPAEDRRALRARLALPQQAFLTLTARPLNNRYGLRELVEAFRTARERFPNLFLVICGDGPLREELQRQVATSGLAAAVRLTGFVPEADLLAYYQCADLFILPTKQMEGFGIVSAEALSCGTPVLATPVGANPEVVGGLSLDLLTQGTSAEQIARGITSFLSSPYAEPDFRPTCRRYAEERYSIEAVAPQWEAALLEAIARSRNGHHN